MRNFIKRIRRTFAVWLKDRRAWIAQGRRRDRWVITHRGTFDHNGISDWVLTNRYCRDLTVNGINIEGDFATATIGGYTRDQFALLRYVS